jgi:short-subunit dehydrogenase
MALNWKTVWITGASTGIGRELALQLARRGCKVAISARSQAKLDELAGQQPGLFVCPLDVTDAAAVARAHAEITSRLGPIDLAVLNAGVWDPLDSSKYEAARAAASMAVNYGGIANALEPLIRDMTARRAGHLALVASVAGYRGLPKGVAYAPSKAAVISLAEVLRLELEAHGIRVSLINPGFVDTPMTAVNKFPMPFMVTPAEAAGKMIAGLERGRFEITFPWQLVSALKLLRVLPYPVYRALARRMTGGRQM